MSDRMSITESIANRPITDIIAGVLRSTLDAAAGYSCVNEAETILMRLRAQQVAVEQLPEQHIGYQAENTITEFRFGDYCAGVTVSRDDAGQLRIYVIGGEEEMSLPQAREFFVAGLAAVIAAEAVANVV